MRNAARFMVRVFALALLPSTALAATIVADVSGVKPGPVAVSAGRELVVAWTGDGQHRVEARFSLDTTHPLLSSISIDGAHIVDDASPYYRCTTGKRKGGWDVFFDAPALNPAGTRQFVQSFAPTRATATTVGNRVEITFDGMTLGPFHGSLRYTFYPGTALIQQAAILATDEPDTAFYYDAGLQMAEKADVRPGLNMASKIAFYDPDDKLQEVTPSYGSERRTATVRYRAIAANSGGGSLVVLPPPHRYFFARDYTTNQGYAWYSAWRGRVGVGVQQYPDDGTAIDPWINAPPGSEQEMSLFLVPSALPAAAAVRDVRRFTHDDHYPHLDGFVTFAPHWHLAYTVQALEKGKDWVPPFKPAMEAAGIDSAMIMDFHIEGHPADLTGIRLQELEAYYRLTKSLSDRRFLVLPAEEADVYLGGHWGLVFPHPVFWYQDRKPGEPFVSPDPRYGKVYRVHDAEEMWKVVKAEDGLAYETHPRTKGSTGYPDKILDTSYFRDRSYLGVGWKAMSSDLSIPRLGERAFKTLDDLNNLGLHKEMIGEVDVFQISTRDELYAHLNVNYLRLETLPDFDHRDRLLQALRRGDGFITTGEILLPSLSLTAKGRDAVDVQAKIVSTFPLRFAEVVWGDGSATHRKIIDLQSTPAFDDHLYHWTVETPHWTWARFAVWDIAADGAFANPLWNSDPSR